MRFIYVPFITDSSFEPLEMAIYPSNADLSKAWHPCKHPERPIDGNASVKHFHNGVECKGCSIAHEAFIKQNAPYSKET